jgi:integrase
MASKREYGTGGVSWLGPRRARLRIHKEGRRYTKVVHVSQRNRGGQGEANEAMRAFVAEIDAQMAHPHSQRPLSEVMEAYIAQQRRTGKRQGSLEVYGRVSKRLDDIAGYAVADLTPHDLDTFYGRLRDRGLSDQTIRSTHDVVSAALEQARKWGWVESNPAKDATPPVPKAKPKERLTPVQVGQLFTLAMEREEPVLAMAIFVASYTGARRGELCALRWDDLDTNAATLGVRRQFVPRAGGGQALEELKSDTGTTDGVRVIHLDTRVLGVLERWRGHQQTLNALGREPEGWLLSHDGGHTPLHAKSLGNAMTELGAKLGLKISTHTFRRFADTQLVAGNVDVDTAARRSGHTPQVMLARYTQGTDDRAVAASVTLADRLVDQGLAIEELLA